MKILIDGVIFQLQRHRPLGISRFWLDFIPELVKGMSDTEFYYLKREDYGPNFDGTIGISTKPYVLGHDLLLEADDDTLTGICKKVKADFFMSTYYTRAHNVKNILRLHDMIPELKRFSSSNPEWVSKRRAVQNASHIVSVSNATRDDFLELYPHFPEGAITVSFTAASRDFHLPNNGEISAFRDAFDIPGRYFLMVGNHGDYKNGKNGVLAYAGAENLDRDISLVIIGSEVIYQVPKDANIIQLPWVDQQYMAGAFGGALGLVYPSLMEGFGLPLLEALQCGCPTICAKDTPLTEVLGDVGLYIDPLSPTSIGFAMEKLSRGDERTSMVQKCLERAKLFTWENVVSHYKTVFEMMK